MYINMLQESAGEAKDWKSQQVQSAPKMWFTV